MRGPLYFTPYTPSFTHGPLMPRPCSGGLLGFGFLFLSLLLSHDEEGDVPSSQLKVHCVRWFIPHKLRARSACVCVRDSRRACCECKAERLKEMQVAS